MELPELYDTILSLVAQTADDEDSSAVENALTRIQLVSQARVVLDIIEGQTVHQLRSTLPQVSYGDIGAAQGITKQASRVRHTKLEQVLKVHQLDGRRHSMSKVAVSGQHRRAARPARAERRATH